MAKKTLFEAKFLDQIKEKLEAEKIRLEEELAKFTTKNDKVEGDYEAVFPQYGEKSDENALELSQFLTDKPLEMTLEKSLRDVNKALEILKKGNYGTCKYCKQPIDEKRLLARPTSGACVSCKKTLTNEI